MRTLETLIFLVKTTVKFRVLQISKINRIFPIPFQYLPSNIFFAFLQIFFPFPQIFFFDFLQIVFAFLQIFFFVAFLHFFLLPFKNISFPSNIFAFLQILLLSFFFKKIGMTKFYQLENQSI